MLFSHISDTHLGMVQYGSEEREQDVYHAFNQAIDISVRDHVDFVIFAGDIFHVPNPSGTAILQMANALKRLKQNGIDSFFILGEHDISRIRASPIPYVYHNLEFSRYIGHGKPVEHKGVLLVGFDKIRRTEIRGFEEKFSYIDRAVKVHDGHRILVMHQGITEFNKFAGELQSTDLPKNFSYYAMGHLHDTDCRQFGHLGGPVAYPGSIEITASEGIKDTTKGFFEVDISAKDARPSWIRLDTRPQFSFSSEYGDLPQSVGEMAEKISGYSRKPVIEIQIRGDDIETDRIQAQVSRLREQTLRCFWKIISKQSPDSAVFLDNPKAINEELFRLSVDALGSEKAANFAIRELLPLLSSNQTEEASQAIAEDYEQYKKEREK